MNDETDFMLPSLEEQLQREQRVCLACGYEVTNPLVERCPRCFFQLPVIEVHCEGCFHHFSCPAARSNQHHK